MQQTVTKDFHGAFDIFTSCSGRNRNVRCVYKALKKARKKADDVFV